MKISFLTSAHFPKDDRIYYHMTKSLVNSGENVQIISSYSKFIEDKNINMISFDGSKHSLKEKIKKYIHFLTKFNPECIICSEPITVYAAKKYSRIKSTHIIYDITEWYPSKKNLKNHRHILKPVFFVFYFSLYIKALFFTDAFIFGEYYKSRIPRMLFPKKPFEFISYYPNSNIISHAKPQLKKNILNLSYSGSINRDKGFENFINVVSEITKLKSELKIFIKIITLDRIAENSLYSELITNLPKQIKIETYPFQELSKFLNIIKDSDIFLDLRANDFENTHCLPIKLFNYLSLERPVIFTNLKAIRKEIPMEDFGYLVNPLDHKNIAHLILDYLTNENKYLLHCTNARHASIDKYNWKLEIPKLISLIKSFKA